MILELSMLDIQLLRHALQADRAFLGADPTAKDAADALDRRLADLQERCDVEEARTRDADAYAREVRRQHAADGCTLDRCLDRVEDEARREALSWQGY